MSDTQKDAMARRIKAQEKAELDRVAELAKREADRKKASEDDGDTEVAQAVPMA